MDVRMARRREAGQWLYRQKKYEAALKCFDAIISDCANPPLGVLDNRAATHAKLNNLPLALQDGKRMIHVAKTDVKGYLRTGQILQLMEKHKVAVDIYSYGLRNVVGPADRELLRGMFDKLSSGRSPPKAVDPLQVLPLELLEMILQYLQFHHVISILRVSKTWKHFIESVLGPWQHLDLSRARRKVPMAFIRSCVQNSKGTMKAATIHRAGRHGHKGVWDALSKCKMIEYLEIRDGFCNATLLKAAPQLSRLTTLILSANREVTLDQVTALLEQLSSLERAEFHAVQNSNDDAKWQGDLSKLQILKLIHPIRVDSLVSALSLPMLISKVPSLRQLSIKGWMQLDRDNRRGIDLSPLAQLEGLDVPDSLFIQFGDLPESLQTIRIGGQRSHQGGGQRLPPRPRLPKLHRLVLQCMIYNSNEPEIPMPVPGALRCLALSHALMMYSLNYFLREGLLTEVQHISLTDNSDVDDAVIKRLADECYQLESMEIRYNGRVSGVGVKALVLKPGAPMKKMSFFHCSGIGLDAIDYARAHGVEVRFGFPDLALGGKKTRTN